MKAVRVHELGGAEVLRYEEVPEPKPQSDQAVVQIAAAGVNYLDVYYRSGFHWGGHHQRPLPYVPGAEAAGTVIEVGASVTNVSFARCQVGIFTSYRPSSISRRRQLRCFKA